MSNYLLFTPPRTGRNFMQVALFYSTKFWLESNNSDYDLDLTQFDKVFSIAKDPERTIASLATMIDNGKNLLQKNNIENAIFKYNSFMNSINNNNVIIYKYDDLVNNTEKVIIDLSQRVNAEIMIKYDNIEINKLMQKFEIENPHGYRQTFTSDQRYDKILAATRLFDLSQSYLLYNQALEKSVKLNLT